MTDRIPAEVAAITRSRSNAAKVNGGGCYDPKERAYVFGGSAAAGSAPLRFTIEAGVNCPVRNLALVVKNWGALDAKLLSNGKPVTRGTRYRMGRRDMANASGLVVWIRVESDSPLEVALVRAK